ncbi:MAG: hypothetical protein KatS3mg129_3082 [Leptospiraceae bacterium]|nr:MAG: hypothetical protein KatS3mg129_3082 [Leptospiraceae bacterium]
MSINIKISLIFLILLTHNVIYSDCILYSIYNLNEKHWEDTIDCSEEILNKKYSAGSLFKIFIVSSGFYFNILKKKDIKEVQYFMRKSDNDYFLKLLNKINKNNFISFMNNNMKQYIKLNLNSNVFSDDFSYLYGGKLKFYPEEILNWFKLLAIDNSFYMKQTLKTMRIKYKDKTYYGKSGTWGGSAWYCGIIPEKNTKVLCVLNIYKIPYWKKAKQESFLTFIQILIGK